MIGFALGLLASNAGEWAIHKYVLHGRGKDKRSFWSFHFHEHHQASRRNGMVDADYRRSVVGTHAQGKEAAALALGALLWLPLLPIAPGFTAGVLFSHAWYYRVHRRAHLDPEWAREHLPWHYDHHMGPDQDQNWCVSWPWFDWVMGTRVPYTGTEREAKDIAKAERRRRRHAA